MEQVRRTVLVRCAACDQKNRLADRAVLARCGTCRCPLPPLFPARPDWAFPLAFIRYVWRNRQLPPLNGYWQSWRGYAQVKRRYQAASHRFKLLQKEQQAALQKEKKERQAATPTKRGGVEFIRAEEF